MAWGVPLGRSTGPNLGRWVWFGVCLYPLALSLAVVMKGRDEAEELLPKPVGC